MVGEIASGMATVPMAQEEKSTERYRHFDKFLNAIYSSPIAENDGDLKSFLHFLHDIEVLEPSHAVMGAETVNVYQPSKRFDEAYEHLSGRKAKC